MGAEDFLIDRANDAELVIDVLELGDSVANPHSSFQSLVHNLVFLHPCDRRRVVHILGTVFLLVSIHIRVTRCSIEA